MLAIQPFVGNTTINNISLNDVHNGNGSAPVPSGETLILDAPPTSDSTDASSNGLWDSLKPGDVVQFTSTYIVTQQDIDNLQ